MNLRPKTKRRVAVLLLSGAVLVGGAATAVTVRLRHVRARRQAHRDLAMLAYARGDYGTAAWQFDRFLSGSGNTDAPALLADGICHEHLAGSATDHTQLATARVMLTRYLQLDPGDRDAEHQLLQVDRQLGYANDVLMLSRLLLAQNPQDTVALAAEVHTLSATGQYARAEQISRQLNALQPQDVVAQAATLQLMRLDGTPPPQIIARADALLAKSPKDPSFQLLRGLAASWADRPDDAADWLRRAGAATPPLDSSGVLLLGDAFDHLGLFPDATAALASAARQKPADLDLRTARLLRDWELGQTDTILRELGNLRLRDATVDARLLGILGLASSPRDTAAIAAALSARTGDGQATVWAAILRARSINPSMSAADAEQQCQIALDHDPQNAVAAETLGQIDAAVGERDLAIRAWHDAAQLAPAWAEPHRLAAEMLREIGDLNHAAAEAGMALNREPGSPALQALRRDLLIQQTSPGVPDLRPPRETLARLSAAAAANPDATHQLAVLQFRDRQDINLNVPVSSAEWGRISAAFPLDARIQHAVLDAASAWTDRWVIRRAIDRLRRITGDSGLEWRMAQARWLLGSANAGDADAAATLMSEVARLAPESPRPLVIWAEALEREGDVANARERLRAAAALAPGDAGIREQMNALGNTTTKPER